MLSQVVASAYAITSAFRIFIFKTLPKDTMSDHLFLALSVSAMLQMEACLAFEAWAPSRDQRAEAEALWLADSRDRVVKGLRCYCQAHGLLMLVTVNLTVVLLLMNMCFYTVAYFHNLDESFLALVAGIACFQGLAAWALCGEHVWSDEHASQRGVTVGTENIKEKGQPGPAGKNI